MSKVRPLPSSRITRLHRYYGPRRHPERPGLALTSCQLIHTAITVRVSRVAYVLLYMHAVTTTPAGQMEPVRSYCSTCVGFPQSNGGSAPALTVSRPAQCLLTLQPACSRSRQSDPFHRRLQQFRFLHYCFDCYRVERTSSPGGTIPR
jgi:hypothetical protein